MQILVTGANGLLGSTLARLLRAAGHSVRAMVRKTSQVQALQGLNVERVYGDVRDGVALRQACDGCEWVFHTAAVYAYSGYSREDMQATAREGSHNLMQAAADAKVRRVIFTSSAVTLGSSNRPEPLDETANLDENGAPDYFVSKASAERVAIARGRELGVDLVICNPAAFVGAVDGRISPSFQSISGYLVDPFKFTYSGGINLAHVQDIAQGQMLLAQRGETLQRYILGGENYSWADLHTLIADFCGVARPRLKLGRTVAYAGGALMEWLAMLTGKQPLANRAMASQVGRYFWYSHAKATALGYVARPIAATLEDTLPWLLASGSLPNHLRLKLAAK